MVTETKDRDSRDKSIDLLDDTCKTNDTTDDLNKTEDSMEGNLTEDGGSVTQSDDGELNRTTDSLDGNLTEDDCPPLPSSKHPAVLLERQNLPNLPKTSSFGDLTQDTISVNDSRNTFNSGVMSESKQGNLSAINRTTSTVSDGCGTVTRAKSKSRLNNALFMVSNITQSTMDNSTKLFGLTESTINLKSGMSNIDDGGRRIGRIGDKFLPPITEELVAKINKIVSNGNNEETIRRLVELTEEVSRENFNRLAREVDVEYSILERTLENYCEAFQQLKDQCLQKNSSATSTSKGDRIEAHMKSLVDSIEHTKSQLELGIKSYNDQARMLETSSANNVTQIKHLWEQYDGIKEMERQFVQYLDSYRKLRIHYKRLLLSTEARKEKAREEQERNLTILKLNVRKHQKDIEEENKVLQSKKDNLKDLENILNLYMEKIEGDGDQTM
uniref:TACC_C domain-containing protein n=1 Tax=Strongyloides papillosus TaxID=174720 RepID=A0A0N5BHC4_STREA